MKRLIEIGFVKIGEWRLADGRLKPDLTDIAETSNILYAFSSENEILYVGKSTQNLRKRLYGYQNPGISQYTNIKGNKLLLNLLSTGKTIEIYALPDDGKHYIGSFHLNLAAGLEDSIISIVRPTWNISGK